jgi:hypothetical protein
VMSIALRAIAIARRGKSFALRANRDCTQGEVDRAACKSLLHAG